MRPFVRQVLKRSALKQSNSPVSLLSIMAPWVARGSMCLSRLCTRKLNFTRNYSHSGGNYVSVSYKDFGDPLKVLELSKSVLRDVGSDEVLVRMLAAPINPADINMIQGVYPVKPSLPAIGGNEGVGEVIETGGDVKSVKQGDWVVPSFSGWGTWRTLGVCKASDMVKVPNDIPLASVATMSVTSCTAYRMLKDFEQLSPGDVVIQNGGNSGVGKALIQIASYQGLKTVNIVRDRPNIEELTEDLKNLGASYIVTEKFVRTPDMKALMKALPKPKLACNCVGGRGAGELLKWLADNGSMVTYGGMSKQPLMVPAGPLIFRDVKLRGYWMTQWNADNAGSSKKEEMWSDLCDMVRQEKLIAPKYRSTHIEDFVEAVSKSMDSYTDEKQILVMDE